MLRTLIATLVLVTVAATVGAEGKTKKPVGTWVREVGDNKITFVIKEDKVTTAVKMPNGDLAVEASYEVSKDGELKAKITKVVKNEIGAQIDEGSKFSFKYKIADGTLTVSDLKVDDNDAGEGPKQLIEGEYKKEKKEEKKDK
jgi:hypothetical protein